jgi:hypothetical protein
MVGSLVQLARGVLTEEAFKNAKSRRNYEGTKQNWRGLRVVEWSWRGDGAVD